MPHTSRIKASARKSRSSAQERQRRQMLRRRSILADPERLEERLAPAVTSALDVMSGVLTVTSDGADSIAITTGASGKVKINNADPGTGSADSSAIKGIVVT